MSERDDQPRGQTSEQAGKIFISYRRADSEEMAKGIYLKLATLFGTEAVFMDVDSIPLTVDFAEFIRANLRVCSVMLVLIGPDWLDSRNVDGTRRLDQPDDFVRQEIEGAIALDISILPVLVRGAKMPEADKLPPSLRAILIRNGQRLRTGPGFEDDLGQVTDAVKHLRLGESPQPASERDIALQLLGQTMQAYNHDDWWTVEHLAKRLIRILGDRAFADTYLMLGIAEYMQGRYQQAREALEEARRRRRPQPTTLHALARAYLRLGMAREAADLLHEALGEPNISKEETLVILDGLAEAAEALGYWEDLTHISDQALELAPNDQKWQQRQVLAAVRQAFTQSRYRNAQHILDKAHQRWPEDTAIEEARAELFPLPAVPPRLMRLGFRGENHARVQVIIPPTVPVPAGTFLMGSDQQHDTEAGSGETPQHKVTLPAYQIGAFPITVAEYACFTRGDLSILSNLDHPKVDITWREAKEYAAWLATLTGQPWRLPTEAEWEKAARWEPETGMSRIYPWGDTWETDRANSIESQIGHTTSVGKYSAGASPCGAQDMAGNVWEWTSTLYDGYEYDYDPGDGRENADATGDRVMRGGAWNNNARYVRAAYRAKADPNVPRATVGVRLLLAAPAPSQD